MKIDKKQVIPNIGFPDHLASDETKNTEEFGLQMAQAIQYEWFRRPNGGGSCPFYDQRDEYHKLRLYARGEQSTKIYKDLLNGGDDDSYSNYDWRPLQIIPKFVKLIVNQMSERLFDIKAEATDKFSTDLKDGYRNALQSMMIARPIMEEAKNQLGIDMFPEGFETYPHTQEEIDLHMQLEYKPAIEIACEEALKFTLDLNDYAETQSKIIEDIVVLGKGGLKHSTDLGKGIAVKYCDPAMMINSFARKRNFEDVYYYGEVERISINELKRISNNRYTDDELREMVAQSSEFYRYENNTNEGSNINSDDFAGMMVDVMNFTFKSTNTLSFKKKYMSNGGFKMTKKESTFNKGKYAEGFDAVKKTIDVWYEGTIVLGTEFIFNYGLCKNMIRPEGLLNITIPNFIFFAPELYQNRTRSTVQRIIPYVDQMQQIHIKIQQLVAKARPNGIFIDIDGLSEIDLGDGNILTPLQLIKIYDQTGNIIGTSVTAEGDYNYGRSPIQELKNGIVSGLPELINLYNHYMNLVRDAIGIPVGADASTPHPDMLVGVQQQLALNSNTALRHILDASLSISQKLGKGLALRLKDIFKYPNLKNVYINAIGKLNVDVLKALENYHIHDLGINIELKPDFQEEQQLEININNAIAKGLIGVEDAIDIKSIKNIKLANQLLKVRKAKKEATERAHQEKMIQVQGQSQAQAAQAAGQAKQQEIQIGAQAEIAVVDAKKQAKLAEIDAETQAKAMLMEKEFHYNMVLKGITDSQAQQLQEQAENRKDARQDKQNTQMSAIQEQKMKGLPAQDFSKGENPAMPTEPIQNAQQDLGTFESSNDHVNGDMGLGDLEPQ
jgi:hypothetical protein